MFALQNKTFKTIVMRKAIIFTIIPFLLLSCGDKKSSNDDSAEVKKVQTEPQPVEVKVIDTGTFKSQLFSNGILHSARKAELRFRTSGILKAIKVVNGERVAKNTLIAALQNKKEYLALEQAKDQVESALIELNSQLIMHGGKQNDTNSVSKQMLNSLKIQSGYNRALNQQKQARLAYNNTFLRAPFTGVVSGIKAQSFNMISPSDIFCTLLDNSSYIVEFTILESESARVNKGMEITIEPFAGDTSQLAGVITEINPTVDKNGLITVKASVNSIPAGLSLFDGMNVRVIIDNTVPGKIIIPKEALVLRSNRKVVFTYENGLAKWNYVKTSLENSTQYVVTEGLAPGDSVIVKGNLNLAHDAKVKIEK